MRNDLCDLIVTFSNDPGQINRIHRNSFKHKYRYNIKKTKLETYILHVKSSKNISKFKTITKI